MINHQRAFPLLFLLVSFSAVTAGEASKTLINDVTAVSNNDSGSIGRRCDETKCRAPIVQQIPFMNHKHPFRGYCWATESNLSDSARKKELCAEGYEARPTTDETVRRPDYVGEEHIEFTCCPENHNDFEAGMVRNCDSSACRDFDSNCWEGTSGNNVLNPMLCEESGRFQHPNLVATEGNFMVYTCCATGDGILTGPYYKNSAFYWSLVPVVVLSTVVATALSVLIASILTSTKARSENFNLYIVFVAIPDWVFNVAFIAICSLCLAGTKRDLYMWWRYFAGACALANMLINAIISYEVHNMVMRTYRCQRTDPPSVPRICAQCGGASAAAFGLVAIMFFSGGNGMTYMIVMGLAFLLVFGAFGYAIWAYCRMRKTGLLSTQGRSRVLALYFGRIVFVFVGFFIPIVLIIIYYRFRAWNPNNGEWPMLVTTHLGILQGLASSAMAVTKPDIRQAVEDFKSTMLGTIPACWSGCSLRTVTDSDSEPAASENTPSTRNSASPDEANDEESAGHCYESKQDVRNVPMAVLPTGRVVPAVPIAGNPSEASKDKTKAGHLSTHDDKHDDNPSPPAEGDPG